MINVMDSKQVVKELTSLVELDYDAIAAYESAIERLDDPAFREKLAEFKADHETHVNNLSSVIRSEGGTPPDGGGFKKILTQGQVVMAGLAGDKAILKAMKVNEDQTNDKYEEEVEHNFPDPVESLLRKGLSDERRHRAWIETTLQAM